jgi:hypothetical protein
MSIKVGLFFDDKFDETKQRYGNLLKFLPKLQDENLKISQIGKEEVLAHFKTGTRFEYDIAVVHMSYQLEAEKMYQTWFAEDIFKHLLTENTRRIVISKERSSSVSKYVIEKMGADCYFCDVRVNEGEFLQILRLGNVDDEEVKLRHFSIRIEDGERVKSEMGLAPDGDMLRDEVYFKKAKEKE